MDRHKFPTDLEITRSNFDASGWKESLSQSTDIGYPQMSQALLAAARLALAQERVNHGKVLWLLSDVCSMKLTPTSANEPFIRYGVLQDPRLTALEDFSESDIVFFSQIVDSVDDLWLRARLADVVWVKGKPRNQSFALIAIDAYRLIPLDSNTWVRGGSDCWKRAISLTRTLRANAGSRLEEMVVSIVKGFDGSTEKDEYLRIWLAGLLRSNSLGKSHAETIARKLEANGRAVDGGRGQDFHRAREYLSASIGWYRDLNNETKASELIAMVAENWVAEAEMRSAEGAPGHLVAAGFYENAIQEYRRIPRTRREVNRVDKRIEELRICLNNSGAKSLDAMTVIQTNGIDISETVDKARTLVSGKPVLEALRAFTSFYAGPDVEKLRLSVIERMHRAPMQAMCASHILSRDGRVIARRPGFSLQSKLTADDEIALSAEMIRDHAFTIGLIVHGCIWPALEVLLLEHRICEADFVNLAQSSPLVPKERAVLFGKALFAGYERDFVTALHLLVPQIEHMVRAHLKQAGAKTTNLDAAGIENQIGMSALMELPETAQVFGPNLAFELKSLYCSPFGPNLRNELAHGLLEVDDLQSSHVVYAWWMALRLTFTTWWNSARSVQSSESRESDVAA